MAERKPFEEYIGKTFTMKNGEVAKVIGGTRTKTKVEFLGNYPSIRECTLGALKKGLVKNLMRPNVYGVGIPGGIYTKDAHKKEYQVWADMLYRCSDYYKTKYINTYSDAFVADDFVCFTDFYKWITSQPSYEKWKSGHHWCLDKDIIGGKGNKIYSGKNCSLVPNNVNTLFVKKDLNRGNLPIGVTKNHDNYMAMCSDPFLHKNNYYLGTYNTPEQAFKVYKTYKEDIIKRVAEDEYLKGNIIKECYLSMLSYSVEITD